MANPGEEVTGNYLKWVLGCDFVEYNLSLEEEQGEIDVIGYRADERTVYICEVATHLEIGLQYTKNGRPDNVDRLFKKFEKDMRYAMDYWPDSGVIFMFWSPIIKIAKPNAKNDQMKDLELVQKKLIEKFGDYGKIEFIINEKYLECLQELQKTAIEHTEAMPTTIMMFLQIFEKTKKHVTKLNNTNSSSLNKRQTYENTMNFDEFWKQLQTKLKHEKEFRTLKQRKKFTASFEISTRGIPAVRIITEEGASRGPIQSNEFQGVWDNAKGYSRETRFLNKGRRLEPYLTKNKGMGKSMQVSYITTLIDYVVKDQNMI